MSQVTERDYFTQKYDGHPRYAFDFVNFFKQRLKLKKLIYLLDYEGYPSFPYPRNAFERREDQIHDLQDLKKIEMYERTKRTHTNDTKGVYYRRCCFFGKNSHK